MSERETDKLEVHTSSDAENDFTSDMSQTVYHTYEFLQKL